MLSQKAEVVWATVRIARCCPCSEWSSAVKSFLCRTCRRELIGVFRCFVGFLSPVVWKQRAHKVCAAFDPAGGTVPAPRSYPHGRIRVRVCYVSLDSGLHVGRVDTRQKEGSYTRVSCSSTLDVVGISGFFREVTPMHAPLENRGRSRGYRRISEPGQRA